MDAGVFRNTRVSAGAKEQLTDGVQSSHLQATRRAARRKHAVSAGNAEYPFFEAVVII
jgi:hypothetical protein